MNAGVCLRKTKLERDARSAQVKKKSEESLGTMLAHSKPVAPPMESTTAGFLWVGILDTLEAFHSDSWCMD
jgi:hypothetical protein